MGIQKKIFAIIIIFFLWSPVSLAQGDFAPYENKKKIKKLVKEKSATPTVGAKKKDLGQDAVIIQDGAPVYEVANFDSPVLEYLEQGKKVKVSKKLYPGIGGLGAFYRIRVAKGKYGYITDVDIEITGKSAKKSDKKPDQPPSSDPLFGNDPSVMNPELENDEPLDPEAGSPAGAKFVGLSYASYNYTEVIANQKKTAQTPMFGVKVSGSTGFMGGAPLDLELVFTTTAPDFYDKVANSTSGFMFIGNAIMMIPISSFRLGSLYYGVGLMSRYSTWEVELKGQEGKPPIDSQEISIGLAGELGFAWYVTPKMAIRLEGKYFYEQEAYFGYDAALQFKF